MAPRFFCNSFVPLLTSPCHRDLLCLQKHLLMETNKGVAVFYAENRARWRQWLKKHSRREKEIYLVLYSKYSDTPCVRYEEAVEEALCFGWIDSHKNKRDADSAYQRFSPRKPRSNWSASNVARVERLIRAGKMTPEGQRLIDLAREQGTWPVAPPEA